MADQIGFGKWQFNDKPIVIDTSCVSESRPEIESLWRAWPRHVGSAQYAKAFRAACVMTSCIAARPIPLP